MLHCHRQPTPGRVEVVLRLRPGPGPEQVAQARQVLGVKSAQAPQPAIGYLPAEEERKLVNFDFKQVRLGNLMQKERIIQLRAAITDHVFLHERLGDYVQRLVANTRPYNPDTDWLKHSPSELVESGVDLGASPRAIIVWGRLAKVWALLVRRWRRDHEGEPPAALLAAFDALVAQVEELS